ncbi:MAG: choice-of-anchor D domain-containing protein, partial [Myxococcota bacterium]
MIHRLFPIVLLVTPGCVETSLSGFTGGRGDGDSIIELSPDVLEFGTLRADDAPLVRSFTIRSVGNNDVNVEDLELIGAAIGSYSFEVEPPPFTLPSGGFMQVNVSFSPVGAFEQNAQLAVTSNAVNLPKGIVSLNGDGAVPELRIEPSPADFSQALVGCAVSEVLTLTNVGTD